MTKNNAENNGLFLWCKFSAKYSFFNARETFHEYIYIYMLPAKCEIPPFAKCLGISRNDGLIRHFEKCMNQAKCEIIVIIYLYTVIIINFVKLHCGQNNNYPYQPKPNITSNIRLLGLNYIWLLGLNHVWLLGLNHVRLGLNYVRLLGLNYVRLIGLNHVRLIGLNHVRLLISHLPVKCPSFREMPDEAAISRNAGHFSGISRNAGISNFVGDIYI